MQHRPATTGRPYRWTASWCALPGNPPAAPPPSWRRWGCRTLRHVLDDVAALSTPNAPARAVVLFIVFVGEAMDRPADVSLHSRLCGSPRPIRQPRQRISTPALPTAAIRRRFSGDVLDALPPDVWLHVLEVPPPDVWRKTAAVAVLQAVDKARHTGDNRNRMADAANEGRSCCYTRTTIRT